MKVIFKALTSTWLAKEMKEETKLLLKYSGNLDIRVEVMKPRELFG